MRSLILALARRDALKGCIDPKMPKPASPGKTKLHDWVREVIRFKHSSPTHRTGLHRLDETFYRLSWHAPPREMSEREVNEFLTHLAREGNRVASTQNQARSAVCA